MKIQLFLKNGSARRVATKNNKLELLPNIMFNDILEKEYKLELELLDRFLKFSSELLRLSLLGIAVVGFIFTNFDPVLKIASQNTKILLTLGIIFLALSSAFALTHRYLATDAFRFFCYGLRIHNNNSESEKKTIQYKAEDALKKRRSRLRFGPITKILSSIFLLLGAVLISTAFINIILCF